MCDFISWIEVQKNNETVYLYLTDKDVFSTDGREILGDCKDNDIIGHGAIRRYYNLNSHQGKEREEINFWKKNAPIPREIKDKIKEFNKHWGKMWNSGAFQNDDLCYIIEYAPKEFKQKAWNRLLKQNPTNYDLKYIVISAPKEFKQKAWNRILKQNPTNYDLCYITRHSTPKYKEKAWTELLKQNPTNSDLTYIIEYAPKEFKQKAWNKPLKQNPTNSDLRYIVISAPKEFKQKAKKIFYQK